MYQKLLKNIQARINSKDNKKVNMKTNDDGSSDNNSSLMNNNNNNNMNSSIDKPRPKQSSKGTKNHINNNIKTNDINNSNNNTNNNNNNTNNGGGGGDNEDEKDIYSIEDLLNAEQSLREVQNADDRKALFIKKLKLCCIIFDFTVGDLDQNHQLAKEMKRTYLLELVEYISQSKHWFSEDCVPVILEMIGKNLFRSLPPPVYDDFDPEEDEPNFDPSWYVIIIIIIIQI